LVGVSHFGFIGVSDVFFTARAISGTASGILDWASYMGAAVQAILFGAIWDSTGSATVVFVTIGVLFAAMCALALIAKNMKIRGNT